MKKTIIVAIAAFLNVLLVYSQNYNTSQQGLINGIADFLESEGYKPEKVDDGLKFTYSGKVYYIEVSRTDTEPMYLRLRRYIKYTTKYTKDAVAEQLNSYNALLGVKALCSEKAVILSSEMFLTDSSDFTSIFDYLMTRLILVSFNFSE